MDQTQIIILLIAYILGLVTAMALLAPRYR
jgi:hypothetical protein